MYQNCSENVEVIENYDFSDFFLISLMQNQFGSWLYNWLLLNYLKRAQFCPTFMQNLFDPRQKLKESRANNLRSKFPSKMF